MRLPTPYGPPVQPVFTSQTLADNRDRLVQARRSYLTALVNHRLAVADLRRQTLFDFEAGASLVED